MDVFSQFSVPSAALVPQFMESLERVRASRHSDDWKTLVKTNPVIKQWRFFLSLDPYTRWAMVKPRGYPGDATLMDFAYGHASIQHHIEHSGETGKEIYRYTAGAPQSQSARQRISLLSTKITTLADTNSSLNVISFAAGHAREIENLSDATKTRVASFTAIDLDPTSLYNASESARNIQFVPIRRNVIKDEDIGEFPAADLVYSLGLFDYLSEEHAINVLLKMWSRTKELGQCIIANLAPDAGNLGYCEAIMDWWMITRSADEMKAIGEKIASKVSDVKSLEVSRHGCFNYLTLTRA